MIYKSHGPRNLKINPLLSFVTFVKQLFLTKKAKLITSIGNIVTSISVQRDVELDFLTFQANLLMRNCIARKKVNYLTVQNLFKCAKEASNIKAL